MESVKLAEKQKKLLPFLDAGAEQKGFMILSVLNGKSMV